MYSPKILQEDSFLTDGGLETTLVFDYGISLPHFAAFELLNHKEGRAALQRYYLPYLQLARKYDLGFVLETPTWRANTDWGFKLGYAQEELDQINQRSVRFVRELCSALSAKIPILISGNIGPRGDGYTVSTAMTVMESQAYHIKQVSAFAKEQVDIITAITLNYSEEAIGIVSAAKEKDLAVAISFTVETDGHLPNGESLQAAIERTDEYTDGYASHFMINCAHPSHFSGKLHEAASWQNRIWGIRANASRKSHAELDESETLDPGDKCDLAKQYRQLRTALPALRIIGGCCGTDHTHIEEICQELFVSAEIPKPTKTV